MAPEPTLKFPHPFFFREREPITLIARRMSTFSGEIRQKPGWWDKVRDADIVAKWRKEMVYHDKLEVDRLWSGEERFEVGNGNKQWPRDYITDAQLDYVFAELRYDAGQRDEETGIYVSRRSDASYWRSHTDIAAGERCKEGVRIALSDPLRPPGSACARCLCPRVCARRGEGLASGV